MSLAERSIPNEAAPAAIPRRRQLLFGASFGAAGWAMLILTLLGAYLAVRSGDRTLWLNGKNIPLTQPNVQLGTLIMSSIMIQWAVYSIARDDRGHAYLALGITALMGVAFLNQTWFLYTQTGIRLAADKEGAVFYALTGSHLAMVGCAVIFVALMSIRALGGSFSSRYPDGLSAAALFWHVTVALYTPIWLAVYIMK